jgi:hypothetical protein
MPDGHERFPEPVGPPSRQSAQAETGWLAKAVASGADLDEEQRCGLVAIVEEEGGFTARACQRLAFLLDDESWEPSVEEILALMAAGERWEAVDYASRMD